MRIFRFVFFLFHPHHFCVRGDNYIPRLLLLLAVNGNSGLSWLCDAEPRGGSGVWYGAGYGCLICGTRLHDAGGFLREGAALLDVSVSVARGSV